jgi:hypothetical protein
MATNNDGNPVDSAGNVQVDFVWGNFPMQPNDERADGTPTATVTTNPVGNYGGWTNTGTVQSALLDTTKDGHNIATADWAGFPSFIASPYVALVTDAYSDGTTVTYKADNNYVPGQTITITGLPTSAFNLSSVTIAGVTSGSFTVTNGATGTAVYGARGRAEDPTALATADGAFVGGVAYISVPSVLGKTSAVAYKVLEDSGYAGANITTAAGATNTAKTITRINVTSATAATVYASGADTAYPVGTKVAIVAGTGIPTALVGTWTVTGGTSGNIVISGSGWTVADTGTISPASTLKGATGTIKTQSVAASAASVAIGSSITITPFA